MISGECFDKLSNCTELMAENPDYQNTDEAFEMCHKSAGKCGQDVTPAASMWTYVNSLYINYLIIMCIIYMYIRSFKLNNIYIFMHIYIYTYTFCHTVLLWVYIFILLFFSIYF